VKNMKEKLQNVDRIEKQKMELSKHLKRGEVVVPLIAETISENDYSEWKLHPMKGVAASGHLETVGYIISDNDSPLNIANDKTIYVLRSEQPDIEQQGKALRSKLGESATIELVSAAREIQGRGGTRAMGEPWGYGPIRLIVDVGWRVLGS
jgi:hypothetical protein